MSTQLSLLLAISERVAAVAAMLALYDMETP